MLRIKKTIRLPLIQVVFLSIFFFIAASFPTYAAPAAGINRNINFQGKVVKKSDGTNLANTSYNFIFTLYDDPTAGNQLPTGTPWSETQSLTVTDGIFRATLGAITPIPAALNFNSDTIYLSISFNGELFGSRIRLTAVPYAFNSEKVGGLTVTNTTGTLTIPSATTVTFSGANNLTFTTTNITNATLPEGSITLTDTSSNQTFTTKTIGSTGLIFSGAATDISTPSNENLAIVPGGTGKVGIGNTSPSQMIDITGNATASGNITMGGQLQVGRFGYDPVSLGNGSIVYNGATNKFRCYQNSAWTDCIGGGGSLFTDGGTFSYLTSTTDDLILGASTVANASLFMDVSTGGLYLGTNEVLNGNLTLYSSGVGKTDPTIAANAAGDLTLSAPSGKVVVGAGSGNIKMSLTGETSVLLADKITTLTTTNSSTDFTYNRVLTGGVNNQSGKLFLISDTSSGSGTINPDMLVVNSALTSGTFTGNLLRLQVNSVDKFLVDNSGNATASGNLTMGGQLQVGRFGYDPTSLGNGSIVYNGATNKFRCYQNSAWTDCIGAGGTPVWSSITAPTTNLSMNMYQSVGTSFATTFTYGNATSTTNLFNITDTSSNNGTGYMLNITTATSSTLKPFHVSAAGVEAILVDKNGNVGIGNTFPNAKLDVTGAASISGALTVGNGTTNTIQSAYGPLNLAYKSGLNSWTTGLTLQDGTGNIGIGTTGPEYKLDINGAFAGRDWFYSRYGISNLVAGETLRLGASETGNISFSTTNGNDKMNITNTGNVGIGTTNPTAKLDVAGNASVSGNLVLAGGSRSIQTTAMNPLTIGGNTTGNISIQAGNSGVGTVQIGTGGAGSTTPDILVLDSKSDAEGSFKGVNGAMYYNASTNKFRCYENGVWKDCDTTGSGSGGPTMVTKSANQAATQSNTTMQNDSALFFAMTANKAYVIEGFIPVDDSNATADLKYTFIAPSGATMSLWTKTYSSATANVACNIIASAQVCATTINSAVNFIQVHGWVSNGANAGNFQFQFAQNGSVAASFPVIKKGATITYSPAAGADLAEVYFSNDMSLESGDVVSIDSTIESGVKKSNFPYDKNIIGIVSTKPGLLLGELQKQPQGMPINVALSGRVPVKVSTESGAIKAGDFLTSSSISGIAMKSTKTGVVIGQAMTDYDGAGVGVAVVFIKNTVTNGVFASTTLNSKQILEKLIIDGSSILDASQGVNLSEIYTDRVIAGREIIAPKITTNNLVAGLIIADHIQAKQIDGIDEMKNDIALLNIKVASLEAGLVVPEGANSAQIAGLEVVTPHNKGDAPLEASISGALQRIESLSNRMNTLELLSKNASNSGQINTNEELLSSEMNIIASSSGLTLLGNTTIFNLNIIDKFTLGLLTIESDASASGSIQTAVVPLKLQKDSLGNLEIMGSKVVIDTFGNMLVRETITAKELKVNRLTILDEKDATNGAVLSSSAGKSEIAIGETAVKIKTSALTEKSLIFATPENIAVGVAAKRIDETTIEISIASPLSTVLRVGWWIIN